jgi:hypothetical protein
MKVAYLAFLRAALRKLAHAESCDPESMSRGDGRALLDAANVVDDLLKAAIDDVA